MMNSQMPRLFFVIFAALAVVQLSACATIFNEGSQRIYVETSPPATVNAIVHDNKRATYQVQLPTVIRARPSSFSSLVISLDDECYSSSYSVVRQNISNIYWLNVLNWHGFYIDYFTGGMWRYDDQVRVPMNATKPEGTNADCAGEVPVQTQAKMNVMRRSFLGLNPTPANEKQRYNMLSVNWGTWGVGSARRGTGAGFSYLRYLSKQDMINISVHRNQRNTCAYFYCGGYYTYQNAVLVSFRRHLNPNSNFFGGVGAARVYISQTSGYYLYDDIYSVRGEDWSDNVDTLFLETGWLVRKGLLTYKVRAVVDLAEFSIMHPSFSDKYYLARDVSSSFDKRRVADYRAAASLTGIEFGIGFSF